MKSVSYIRTVPLAAAALALIMSGTASGETSPYYIGVSQSLTHDSNVLRSSSQPISDLYSSTGLLAGFDQPIGRQRVYANGLINYNRYRDQKTLNNTSYGLNAGADLATIESITGGVNYSLNQSLVNYGSANQADFSGKNIERSQQISARVGWGGAGRLGLDLNGTHRTLRYSTPSLAAAPFEQNAVSFGVTYRPSSLLSLGAGLRATRGSYDAVVVNGLRTLQSDFDRNDLDLTATWMPTGLSTVNARLSFGRQRSETIANRNSSNVTTGSLSWDYKPTGKLSFYTWLSRDTGSETSFFNRTNIITNEQSTSVGDNSRLTNSATVRASYSATAKISVSANARYARRSLDNTSTFNGVTIASSGKDTEKGLTLGVNYQIARSIGLGCTAVRETRSVDGAGTGVTQTFPYAVNTFGCFGQFTLR